MERAQRIPSSDGGRSGAGLPPRALGVEVNKSVQFRIETRDSFQMGFHQFGGGNLPPADCFGHIRGCHGSQVFLWFCLRRHVAPSTEGRGFKSQDHVDNSNSSYNLRTLQLEPKFPNSIFILLQFVKCADNLKRILKLHNVFSVEIARE